MPPKIGLFIFLFLSGLGCQTSPGHNPGTEGVQDPCEVTRKGTFSLRNSQLNFLWKNCTFTISHKGSVIFTEEDISISYTPEVALYLNKAEEILLLNTDRGDGCAVINHLIVFHESGAKVDRIGNCEAPEIQDLYGDLTISYPKHPIHQSKPVPAEKWLYRNGKLAKIE